MSLCGGELLLLEEEEEEAAEGIIVKFLRLIRKSRWGLEEIWREGASGVEERNWDIAIFELSFG